MKTIGIIPARYGSSRFPGKPLADLCGKPMLLRVYERVITTRNLDDVIVATDDERIKDMCGKHNINAILTAATHKTAANRLAEVAQTFNADFYIQINGDEPLINTDAIAACIPSEIPQNYEFGTNIITEINEAPLVNDVSNIKVVFDSDLKALYMSRMPIPTPFSTLDFQYYKHVGIIGYNKKMLDFYANSVPGHFEKIEGIDTLRFIDYGKKLQFVIFHNLKTLSVDTPKDLEIVQKLFLEQGC